MDELCSENGKRGVHITFLWHRLQGSRKPCQEFECVLKIDFYYSATNHHEILTTGDKWDSRRNALFSSYSVAQVKMTPRHCKYYAVNYRLPSLRNFYTFRSLWSALLAFLVGLPASVPTSRCRTFLHYSKFILQSTGLIWVVTWGE